MSALPIQIEDEFSVPSTFPVFQLDLSKLEKSGSTVCRYWSFRLIAVLSKQ